MFLWVSSTCIATSQHRYKPEDSQNGQSSGKKTSRFTSTHDPSLRSWCKDTPELHPKEEMNGEEVWQMHKLKHILIHTAKERISEDVAGIVVFASVSSRSMDRDPIWTPCDRSCYGTCQIWPRHLAKLYVPRKTWKTPYRNYTLDLGTQNC